MYTIDKPLVYRNGHIWQLEDGYHCSWLNESREERPYQALTAAGYAPLATIDEVKAAIDRQTDAAIAERALYDWMSVKDALHHGKPGDLVRRFNSWTGYETVTLIWVHPSKLYGIVSDGTATHTIDDMNIISQTSIGKVDIQQLITRYANAKPRQMTLCDCSHYAAHPMTTSSGTSCPDCYDRMSD